MGDDFSFARKTGVVVKAVSLMRGVLKRVVAQKLTLATTKLYSTHDWRLK